MAQNRTLPVVKAGDLLAVMYRGSLWVHPWRPIIIREPRTSEILVKGGESFVIRERETFEDLVRGGTDPRVP